MSEYKYVHGVTDLENIGELFGDIRQRVNVERKEVAISTGISNTSISDMENGGRYLGIKRTVDLFNSLGYNLVVMAVKKESR
jgi:transcriptional regulator with XRE-family HTH domain